jgi:hypothetical protein
MSHTKDVDDFPVKRRNVNSYLVRRLALGPTLPPDPTGTRGFSPGIKRLGRKADHSPPYRAEAKNAWSYTSTPQHVFISWLLVKHRDNFILILDAVTLHNAGASKGM